MANITLAHIAKSANSPLPDCNGTPECPREVVAEVTLHVGRLIPAPTFWCLACLDRVDLPSVLALIGARPAPALRVVA